MKDINGCYRLSFIIPQILGKVKSAAYPLIKAGFRDAVCIIDFQHRKGWVVGYELVRRVLADFQHRLNILDRVKFNIAHSYSPF